MKPSTEVRCSLALPAPEPVHVIVEEDSLDAGGFLRRRARRMRLAHAGEEPSRAFVYDEAFRSAIDAVVVLPYFERDGARWVLLRTAIRPPVLLREPIEGVLPAEALVPLWEAPAGLVEPGESSVSGLRDAAARELLEETGFRASPEKLRPLGPPTFPCAGVIGESHYFFSIEIDLEKREEPELDGSALEEYFELCAVPLSEALAAARAGRLPDAKTELAIRRLAEEGQP